jgi:Kef-type K+ transport system membrane component KefB
LTLLAAAVVDDILVLLLLSTTIALSGPDSANGAASIIAIVVRLMLYLGVAALFGVFVLPRLVRRVSTLPISEGLIAAVIVTTLIYAWAAEAVGGMAAITGAFLAGLMFAATPLREKIEDGIHTITYGLLVPIFFVSIGLKANARSLDSSALLFTLAIVIVAILSKIFGCGLGARLTGYTNRESLRVGVGMVSRGEVGLIVSSVGLAAGIISQPVFAAMVIVVLVTTLLTPVMLRSAFQKKEKV